MVKDTQASRVYPTVTPAGNTKYVTRDIAALDFLLGIPMEGQMEAVRQGWEREQKLGDPWSVCAGKWWERYVGKANHNSNKTTDPNNKLSSEDGVTFDILEGPVAGNARTKATNAATSSTTNTHGGGRRLEGDTAIKWIIPQHLSKSTRQWQIARQAQLRDWERQVAPQLFGKQDRGDDGTTATSSGGRLFCSAKDAYPISVVSIIPYEPKREEAARRRQKLEACGGGGTQFVVPPRDWRGTSYRSLLPRGGNRKHRQYHYSTECHDQFNRFLDHRQQQKNTEKVTSDDDESRNKEIENSDMFSDASSSSFSSEEEDPYVPGFLDDPEMRQGRHRHVMIGDRVSGCIVSSTIQFVKPDELKADLNKQFRERFDGWEPPQSQLKYIGAKIIDGVYTLLDSKEGNDEEGETIHMPSSLTLSKIRSAKQQIILAAIRNANLEVSTVALSFVYFERLCLDCRVDKSNRRLAFAACLLLAAKINESKLSSLVYHQDNNDRLHSSIQPTKESSIIFAALLEFFTSDWGLSLKNLYRAEWGVFASLGFRLHATPVQVAFHFRRIMKVLGWNTLAYLGHEMYTQWQDCLEATETKNRKREVRRELKREAKERSLFQLELQRQIQANKEEWEEAVAEEGTAPYENNINDIHDEENNHSISKRRNLRVKSKPKPGTAMKLIHRLTSGLTRPSSIERSTLGSDQSFSELPSVVMANEDLVRSSPTAADPLSFTSHDTPRRRTVFRSPSLPLLPDLFPSTFANRSHLGDPLTDTVIKIHDDTLPNSGDLNNSKTGIVKALSEGNMDYDEENVIF
jgi:hypothetical protein